MLFSASKFAVICYRSTGTGNTVETAVKRQGWGWGFAYTFVLWKGFLCGSASKESVCNAGDQGSIPGLGRSAGEGIGHPFQYSWASLWVSWLRIRLQCGRPGFSLWVGKMPWRRERLPTPVFWPGELHGLCNPWSHRVGHDWVTLTFALSSEKQHFLTVFTNQQTFHRTIAPLNKYSHPLSMRHWYSTVYSILFADKIGFATS